MSRPSPISMQDIADALGLSRATVSNALRGRGRLSEDTLKLVRDTAERMNYVPSGLGRALRTGRTAQIGLVLPDFRMPLFAEFARAFSMAAGQRGMVLTVADCRGDGEEQARNLDDLANRGLDALMVVPVRGTDPGQDRLRCPLVVIDAASNPLNAVSADHQAGGALLAQHLADLGHARVLVLHAPGEGAAQSRVNALRLKGLTDTLTARGLAHDIMALPAGFEPARDALAAWVPGATTAIAATYDALAVGALHALNAQGIAVPGRVSVAGFDDTVWGQITLPSLTTIRQDLPALAEQALACALGEAEPGQLLPVTLIPRTSTTSPPDRI